MSTKKTETKTETKTQPTKTMYMLTRASNTDAALKKAKERISEEMAYIVNDFSSKCDRDEALESLESDCCYDSDDCSEVYAVEVTLKVVKVLAKDWKNV